MSLAQRRQLLSKDKTQISLNISDKETFIKEKAAQLYEQFEENKNKCFESFYSVGEELGQGAHASVYKCYSLSDEEANQAYAVKISRESDEERKLAHIKEYAITKNLRHKNVV